MSLIHKKPPRQQIALSFEVSRNILIQQLHPLTSYSETASLKSSTMKEGSTQDSTPHISSTLKRVFTGIYSFVIQHFLEQIYTLVKKKETDQAIRILFHKMNDLYSKNKFDECDEILSNVDAHKLDTNLMIAFLSITLLAKSELKKRTHFVLVIERILKEKEPHRVERLMKGLRG